MPAAGSRFSTQASFRQQRQHRLDPVDSALAQVCFEAWADHGGEDKREKVQRALVQEVNELRNELQQERAARQASDHQRRKLEATVNQLQATLIQEQESLFEASLQGLRRGPNNAGTVDLAEPSEPRPEAHTTKNDARLESALQEALSECDSMHAELAASEERWAAKLRQQRLDAQAELATTRAELAVVTQELQESVRAEVIPQERLQHRSVEMVVHVPAPMHQEHIIQQVQKVIPQERVQQRSVEMLVDAPARMQQEPATIQQISNHWDHLEREPPPIPQMDNEWVNLAPLQAASLPPWSQSSEVAHSVYPDVSSPLLQAPNQHETGGPRNAVTDRALYNGAFCGLAAGWSGTNSANAIVTACDVPPSEPTGSTSASSAFRQAKSPLQFAARQLGHLDQLRGQQPRMVSPTLGRRPSPTSQQPSPSNEARVGILRAR